MTRTLASLALLKANFDSDNKDYIDLFVPFIVSLVNRKKYEIIEVKDVCKDFETEFGLKIPYHPIQSILDRARKFGYLRRDRTGKLRIIHEKVVDGDFSDIAAQMEQKYNALIQGFLEFTRSSFDVEISGERANEIFIAYLRDHDLDMLFAKFENESLLPNVETSGTDKFLINEFIRHVYERSPGLFDFVADISVGHILANTILFRTNETQIFQQARLDNSQYYLDIGLLFSIIGVNGPFKRQAYREFVELCNKQGANLFVFQHTLDEFLGILETTLNYLEAPTIDYSRSSSALIYFRDEGFTKSDVIQLISSIEKLLMSFGISVIRTPNPNIDQQFQIDEEALEEKIIEIYRVSQPKFDAEEKALTLAMDVKSISAIHKLRKGNFPINLSDARHLFVTTNSSLAYASRQFERSLLDQPYFFIPTTVSDVFLGTLVWVGSPIDTSTTLNQKRLIANRALC